MWIKPDLLDLTYCTNVHPGESWSDVLRHISDYVLPLKERLSPGAPFGIGLRLSAAAAEELRRGSNLQDFKRYLDEHGLYVALINGFPYGSFHGTTVKSQVFAPDWRSDARLRYTIDLIEILKELLPRGIDGGISTIPLSYKPWITEAESAWDEIIRTLVEVVAVLVRLRRETGRLIHLDIEPEPDGLVENTDELIAFFCGRLSGNAEAALACRLRISHTEARQYLFDHLQVCLDTCHLAVEYENPGTSIKRFLANGIRIGRLQISSALRVNFSAPDCRPARAADKAAALGPFADSVYLHQVIERRADGTLRRWRDLPEALANGHDDAREWRIHYHVPLFTAEYGALSSTQNENRHALAAVTETGATRHLEIETYTWEVLPPALKIDLLSSIEREYRWVIHELCTRP